MKNIFRIILLSILFLGFLFVGIGQQVITTTSTTVITIPGTTYTTTLPGGISTITIIFPQFTIVEAYKAPDQVCTIVLRPQKAEPVVEVPGTTVIVPGTTYQTVIRESMVKYSETEEIGGTETTTTAFTYYEFNIVTTIEIPAGATTTYTAYTYPMMIPFYGEIVERCEKIVVVREMTLVVDNVPATIYVEYPGMSLAFEGTTFTVEELEEIVIPTTTIVETRPGETYKTTYIQEATTILSTVEAPAGVTVISSPGKVVTSTITYVTTLEETARTTPYTSPTITQTTPPTETRVQTTQTPTVFAGLGPELIIIVIAVAVIAIVIAIFLARRITRF
ncbi:MAG: hypothetical protein NZ929_06200 [Aigarchaeota archaeon]|nr:hypothetical protein [Aigarchaeota archaeon]